MAFNFNNDRPIYIQLIEQLELYIISGKIELGSRLPSVRDFSLEYKVNPNTMQKALIELEAKGLIYTERTNGKFVTKDKVLIKKIKENIIKDKINIFIEDLDKIGINKKDVIEYLKGEK